MSSPSLLLANKKLVALLAVVLLLLIATAGWVVYSAQMNNSQPNTSTNEAIEAPAFNTLLPNGKTIASLGGWSRISPPTIDPVYAYKDTINDISVTVSQQPLPESFTGTVDSKVADVAKNYNATTSIQASDTKAYIGTSATGPQSVIFTENNLLILIKSQQKIEDKSWISYIYSLK